MSEERAQQFAALLDAALHGTQEQINSATEALLRAYEEVNTILDLLIVMQHHENEQIRHQSAIAVRRLVIFHDINAEFMIMIRPTLLNLLQTEPNIAIKRAIGDIAVELIKEKTIEPWNDFFNTLLAFFQNAELLPVSLYIWSNAALLLNEDELTPFINPLLNVVIQILTNQEGPIVEAINLFDILAGPIDEETFNEYPTLPQILLTEAQNAVTVRGDSCEVFTIFGSLSHLVFNDFAPLYTISHELVDLILNVTVHEEIDVNLKSACQNFMAATARLDPEYVSDQLPFFMNASLNLAVQLIALYRDADIEFIVTFIDSYLLNTEIPEQIVSFVINFAMGAINHKNIAQIQVGLIAIAALFDKASDEILDHEDAVMNIAGVGLEDTDPYIFDAACSLLIQAAENSPLIYTSCFDDVLKLLFNRLDEPRALSTLESLMFNAEVPPQLYREILTTLTNLLSTSAEEMYEPIVSCMTSAISKVEDVNNEIYEEMKSILAQLLTAESGIRAKVFELIGYLTKIAPHSIHGDMQDIMTHLYQSISENDDNINESIAMCIKNIAKVLPLDVQPYVENFVPQLIEMLKKEVKHSDEEDVEEEDDEMLRISSSVGSTEKMQASALNCLTTLITELSQNMVPYVDNCVEAVVQYLDSNDPWLQTSAAQSILLMNDGLLALQYNCTSLFNSVIENINKTTDIEAINELYVALGGLFICWPQLFNDAEIVQSVLTLYEYSFCLDPKGKRIATLYCQPKEFDPSILDSLFFSIRMLIQSVGTSFEQIAEQFVGFLSPHLSSKKNQTKAYIIHTYSVIYYTCPSLTNLGKTVATNALKIMPKQSNSTKNVLLSALNFLVNTNISLLTTSQINQIRTHATSIVKSRASGQNESDMIVGTATTLLCSIIMEKQETRTKTDDLNTLLTLLPPEIDDDDIPFAAKFIVYASNTWPELTNPHLKRITINIFASSICYIRLIPNEILAALSTVFNDVNPEELESLLKWNQHYVLQVQSTIQKVQQ